VFKLIPYDGLSPPILLTVGRPATLFYVHRQPDFCVEPDPVNPLDRIFSVLGGTYFESYAIAFVNRPKGLLVIQRSEQIRMGLRRNTIPPFPA